MIKIMLVEDDKSLREIYGVRLLAEGYDIVSAGDGEEALAMAIKERPQLIISDVMMPKVSGYDMLDILRSTTETKNIRVIMMTALSSDEQRSRAESLGADRYLVKSQVGIEDVVRVVHEVLGDNVAAAPAAAPVAPAVPAPAATAQAPAAPVMPSPNLNVPPRPVQAPTATVTPMPAPVPTPQPITPIAPPVTPAVSPLPIPSAPPVAAPTPAPQAPEKAAEVPGMQTPKPASLKTRVIQPLSDPNISPVDINDLLNKELAKEASLNGGELPPIPTADEEKALVNEQLQSFQPPEPTPVEPPAPLVTPEPAPVSPLMPTPGLSESMPAAPAPTETSPSSIEQENPSPTA